MSNHSTFLGALIAPDTDARRDAIHVAITPVIAAPDTNLFPGQPFKLDDQGRAVVVAHVNDATGVVDPFLKTAVRPGERFYGCLYPGTVTGLRHEWDHAAFSKPVAPTPEPIVREVEKPEDPEITKLRDYMTQRGIDADTLIADADEIANDSCRGC